ncbi:hypothetical protein [Dapis sp. BLCC M229]|uniref:hypothetical protein n=1 Tax=Dapis sp. BLCC M229 TaxID=3400188 RepID=UPI003CFA0894
MAEKINKITSENNNIISISRLKIQLSNNPPLDFSLSYPITEPNQIAENIETSLAKSNKISPDLSLTPDNI